MVNACAKRENMMPPEYTFEVTNLGEEQVLGPDGRALRLDSSHLIKLDMPELDFDFKQHQNKRLEFQSSEDSNEWRPGTLVSVLPDATVVVRFDDDAHNTEIVDLTKERYRWLYAEATEENA